MRISFLCTDLNLKESFIVTVFFDKEINSPTVKFSYLKRDDVYSMFCEENGCIVEDTGYPLIGN